MSSISAIACLNNDQAELKPLIMTMNHALAHRGRDSEGYIMGTKEDLKCFAGPLTPQHVVEKNKLSQLSEALSRAGISIGVNHAERFYQKVQDFSPYSHPSFPGLFLAIDGCVINFAGVRDELIREGVKHEYIKQEDVLLQAFQHWGERMFMKFEGTWAILLYDQNSNHLFAARDRFGAKPLYYFHDTEYFALASEHKGLLTLPFVSKRLSRTAAFEFLVSGVAEENGSGLFKNITELEPGCTIQVILPKGIIKSWNYFQLTSNNSVNEYSGKKSNGHAQKIRKYFARSLYHNLVGELPIAVYLDGGIEDAAMLYMIKQIQEETRKQQSQNLSNQYFISADLYENKQAQKLYKRMCRDLGSELNVIEAVPDEFIETMDSFLYQQDLPVSNLGNFYEKRVFEQIASKGFKLALADTGAKTMLAGKEEHYHLYMSHLLSRKNFGVFFNNLFSAPTSLSSKGNLLRYLMKNWMYTYTATDVKETLMRNNMLEFTYFRGSFWEKHAKYLQRRIENQADNLNMRLYQEIVGHQFREKLRSQDRSAAFAGIDLRLPYLSDPELADYVYRIGAAFKIRHAQGMYLLKRTMTGIVPEEILQDTHRPVHSFNASHWLGVHRDHLAGILIPELDEFYELKRLKKDWDKLVDNAEKNGSDKLWRIISFSQWFKKFKLTEIT